METRTIVFLFSVVQLLEYDTPLSIVTFIMMLPIISFFCMDINNAFECVGAYHDSCNIAQLFEAQLPQTEYD